MSFNKFDEEPEENYAVLGRIPRAMIGIMGGVSYVLVGAAGGKNLFSYENGIPWFVNAADTTAGICYGLAVYHGIGMPLKRIKQHHVPIYTLAAVSALSAANFYTAGRYGALLFGLPIPAAEVLGVLSFLARAYSAGRGGIIFCGVFPKWLGNLGLLCDADQAKKTTAIQESARLALTLPIAALICLFNTDPLFSVPVHIANQWFGVDANQSQELMIAAYAWAGLMAIASFPFAHMWMHFALQKVTHGMRRDDATVIKPDAYTFAGVALCALLFLLPVLGSANSPEGAAFSKWVGQNNAFLMKLTVLFAYACLSPLLGGESICRQVGQGVQVVRARIAALGCWDKPMAQGGVQDSTKLGPV